MLMFAGHQVWHLVPALSWQGPWGLAAAAGSNRTARLVECGCLGLACRDLSPAMLRRPSSLQSGITPVTHCCLWCSAGTMGPATTAASWKIVAGSLRVRIAAHGRAPQNGEQRQSGR